MGEFLDFFKSKKNLVSILLLGVLMLAVFIGIKFIDQQRIIRSRATGEPIVLTGENVRQKADGKWIVVDPKKPVSLQITSPLGPPGASSPGPSLSPVQAVSASTAASSSPSLSPSPSSSP